jgi:hypothetical protein
MGLFSRFFDPVACLWLDARGYHIRVQKNSIFIRSAG